MTGRKFIFLLLLGVFFLTSITSHEIGNSAGYEGDTSEQASEGL